MLALFKFLIQIDIAAEAAGGSNLFNRQLRIAEKILCRLQPQREDIGIGGHAGLPLEGVDDVVAAVAARRREIIEHDDYRLQVLEIDNRRILKVKFNRISDQGKERQEE